MTDTPANMIPGAREPGMLTTFGPTPVPRITPEGPATMSAETKADRQLEGGGAPSQRPASAGR